MAAEEFALSRLGGGQASFAKHLRDIFLAYDPVTLEAPIAERLRAAQLEASTRHIWLMLLGNIVNAGVIVIVAWGDKCFGAIVAWAAVLALLLIPMARRASHSAGAPVHRAASQRTISRFARNTAVLAAMWGAAPLLLMNEGPSQQLIVTAITAGMLCAGAFGMATLPVVVVAYVLPLGGGFLLSLLLRDEPAHFMAAPVTLGYVGVLIGSAISHARSFADSVIAQARAELAARHDPVTGLPNRAAFDAKLAESFGRLERYGERFALLSVALDEFRTVNDQWGRQTGDQLLRQAADRLRDAVDAQGSIARVGGQEFAVLATNAKDTRDAAALAADIASRFEAAFVLESGSIVCRASVGAAFAPDDGVDAKSLLTSAYKELRRDKRKAKATVAPSLARPAELIQRRRELTRQMRAALARREFFLQYQPVQTLRTRRIEGFEALVRWRHPTLGLIPPLEFIDIAEKNGMIHELGEWILNEALREAALWPADVRIAINVSGAQLCDASFEAIFARAIGASGVDPRRVQIEVTESAALAAVDQAEIALRQIHERGVEIVLDDFGTGYSSFVVLRRLPVGRLKIDRAFVADLPFERESAAIVEAVIGIARALDFAVTAEGVENESQLEYLTLAGVSEAQGFLIAKPLDAASARDLLQRQAPTLRNASAA
jgi:diguanylate cyclase (GGDEF)-like protein